MIDFLADFKGDIGDAHHLAALRIDDLLIEQIPHHPQHVFVGVVRREDFVAQENAV